MNATLLPTSGYGWNAGVYTHLSDIKQCTTARANFFKRIVTKNCRAAETFLVSAGRDLEIVQHSF